MNLSIAAGTAGLAAMTARLNSGTLVWYSGTMPATPQTALSGNTALATFTFSATAFGAASTSGGFTEQTASFVASSVLPSAAGTVSWARALQSNGTTVESDYTVGTGAQDIVIGNTTVATGVNQQMTSFKLRIPTV